jgi:hypothetical protein
MMIMMMMMFSWLVIRCHAIMPIMQCCELFNVDKNDGLGVKVSVASRSLSVEGHVEGSTPLSQLSYRRIDVRITDSDSVNVTLFLIVFGDAVPC